MFKNLIGGEWVEGPRVSRNINPSDTRDVVGEFAQADAGASQAGHRRSRRGASPPGACPRRSSASTSSTPPAPRSWRARPSWATCSPREEGKTLPEAIGEVARAGNIFKFFAGEALRVGRRSGALRAPGRRRGDHARAASASSA